MARFGCFAVTLCALASFFGLDAAKADDSRHLAADYWVPRADLTEAQRRSLPAYCSGAYDIPAPRYPNLTDDSTMPAEATADGVTYVLDEEVLMDGSVRIDQGNRVIYTDRLRVHPITRDAELSGNVVIEDQSAILNGSRAIANLNTKAATLDDVEYLLPEVFYRGQAQQVVQNEAGDLSLRRSQLTRCEPHSNAWVISGRQMRIGQGEVFGTARHAVVRIKSVPIFYTPYIKFPVSDERQSGFLLPNLAVSNEDGVDIGIPYYFNLAPNYDATLTPRYLTERGPALEGEFRHLSRRTESTFGGAYLYRDDQYDGELERDEFRELFFAGEELPPFEPADRWLYNVDHRGAFGAFSTRIDYTAVSDRDYFRDLGTDLGVSNQVELERRGELRYAKNGFLARLWAQRFQRLDAVQVDPYQRLPEVDLNYQGRLAGPLNWSVGGEWVSFDRDNTDLGGIASVIGTRFHAEPRISMPFAWPFGFFNTTLGYRYTAYDLKDAEALGDDQPERSIGFGSVGGGLFFERELKWFDTPLIQTLEPRLFYLYQEFEDQDQLPRFDVSPLTFTYSQLYRDNRFSGNDRFGDANQVSVGLTTRFINQTNGREYFRFSLGEIVYFEDRRVTISPQLTEDDDRHGTSELAAELSATLFRHFRVRGSMVWDPDDDTTDEGAISLSYRRDNRHIVNVGFRRRRQSNEDIEQTDASLYWPVARNWSLIARWNFDLETKRTVEGFGGVEYNNCCMQVRLVARRFLETQGGRILEGAEPDEGVFLQIVFKGLAGFGNSLESVMERGIKGYRYEQNSPF